MGNEDLIQQVITGDLQLLWNLLCVYKDDSTKLQKAYQKVKQGEQIKYHINYILTNRYDDRPRAQEIVLKGRVYTDTDWWEEEENRTTIARKALLEHLEQDGAPYEGRG